MASSLAEAFAAAYVCPDCNARAELVRTDGPVVEAVVRHESTCPRFRADTDRTDR